MLTINELEKILYSSDDFKYYHKSDLKVALYSVICNIDIDIFENITNSELLNILNTDVKIDIK